MAYCQSCADLTARLQTAERASEWCDCGPDENCAVCRGNAAAKLIHRLQERAQTWQPIVTLPPRAWEGRGISCIVTNGGWIVVADDCGILPDGSICGSLPAHSGRMTDWGITHWMPLPRARTEQEPPK